EGVAEGGESGRVIDYVGSQLLKTGYSYYGSEPLYNGITGEVMQVDIFMGVVYYQRLRHMVSDKSQVCVCVCVCGMCMCVYVVFRPTLWMTIFATIITIFQLNTSCRQMVPTFRQSVMNIHESAVYGVLCA
ncbi:hypothetical protein EON65_22770, partial [archaeon]